MYLKLNAIKHTRRKIHVHRSVLGLHATSTASNDVSTIESRVE